MIFGKKYLILFIISLIFLSNVQANTQASNELNQNEQTAEAAVDTQATQATADTKNWHKRLMFLLGSIHGFYLPLTYALTLGLNIIDFSHPVMKENFEPFAKGATLGIGFWLAYKIVQSYLELALLKLQNSADPKIVRDTMAPQPANVPS